ncbi:putative metalloprotease CJM1_0395 family protein [Shewanella morhuae]|uniref:SprA-related family n=1 Tax=Shewanella morhuae TaxID=365591 RepID=A0A379ZUC4_9GAMM|nr:putative metalloprotease CJM1_0395 family protein [Shewanella morhuae]SUI68506.1 SprA-related family [Shewanella morhuae]
MSAMALSPKVSAPSPSFSAQDKTLSSNLSQNHASSTYQGASSQTAGFVKIEASGAYEAHFTGTSTVPVQTAPLASLASHFATKVSPSLHSSPNVPFVEATAQVSSFKPSTLNNRAILHVDASFSLLTGPQSISGVREGQIAQPAFTPAFLSVSAPLSNTASTSNSGLSINSVSKSSLNTTNLINRDTLTPPSPLTDTGGIIGSSRIDVPDISPSSTISISTITPDLAAVFEPAPLTGGTLAKPSAASSTDNNSTTGAAVQTSPSSSNAVAKPSVLEQFTQVFGEATAVTDPLAEHNSDDPLQAFATVFGKNDYQIEKQAQEEALQKQQVAAAEQAKQDQSQAQQAQQLQQVSALKTRDSEVKAHEHAHATVGGQYAQSPSFKYEKGADGQRYATDGEVQIDVSSVGDNPLATINKMKQVYAAAMAPVDPSATDIRVAAQALQKMNEAKVKLAEERQQQIMDLQTTQALVGADAQIKGLPPLQERIPVVTGKVDDSGNIVKEDESVSTLVSDTLDRIKQAVEAQTAKIVTDIHSKTPPDTVNGNNAANTKTTEESIEPPTATLASAVTLASTDLATSFISGSNSTVSRYYAAIAQANP